MSNDNDDEIAKKTGLLDFYSNRAVAHASFFVASIFGLVAFATIVHDLTPTSFILFWLSTLVFFGFSYLAYYAIIRFGFYATIASIIASSGLTQTEVFEKIPIENHSLSEIYYEKHKQQMRILLPLKLRSWAESGKYKESIILVTGSLYWIFIVILGIIVFEKFWLFQSIYLWIWILAMVILTIVFVAVPYIWDLKREEKSEKKK